MIVVHDIENSFWFWWHIKEFVFVLLVLVVIGQTMGKIDREDQPKRRTGT